MCPQHSATTRHIYHIHNSIFFFLCYCYHTFMLLSRQQKKKENPSNFAVVGGGGSGSSSEWWWLLPGNRSKICHVLSFFLWDAIVSDYVCFILFYLVSSIASAAAAFSLKIIPHWNCIRALVLSMPWRLTDSTLLFYYTYT